MEKIKGVVGASEANLGKLSFDNKGFLNCQRQSENKSGLI